MTEYLMEPRYDGVETTVEVHAATEHRKPELIITDRHVNQAASAWVTPEIARALVRALLPLCPEPYPRHPVTYDAYPPFVRDAALVEAAQRVLAPVFAFDNPRDGGGEEPF